MKENLTLSRRQFLELMGLAASAVALGGCTPQEPIPITATPSPEPVTPEPPRQVTLIDPLGFAMVLVEAGNFQMGSASGLPNEQPVHTVNITRPFYMSRHEVTFEDYVRYSQDTASRVPDQDGLVSGDMPVVVTWYEAVEYCNWLSEQSGLTPCYGIGSFTECDFAADGYRLPTEAEWEYAARGGNLSEGFALAGGDEPDEVAWYGGNSDGHQQPVGTKEPNELGLYDMSGNLMEWCWDLYSRDYYAVSPSDDPTGPALSEVDNPQFPQKVRRGGSFQSEFLDLRPTYRSFSVYASHLDVTDGIRLVRLA